MGLENPYNLDSYKMDELLKNSYQPTNNDRMSSYSSIWQKILDYDKKSHTEKVDKIVIKTKSPKMTFREAAKILLNEINL